MDGGFLRDCAPVYLRFSQHKRTRIKKNAQKEKRERVRKRKKKVLSLLPFMAHHSLFAISFAMEQISYPYLNSRRRGKRRQGFSSIPFDWTTDTRAEQRERKDKGQPKKKDKKRMEDRWRLVVVTQILFAGLRDEMTTRVERKFYRVQLREATWEATKGDANLSRTRERGLERAGGLGQS